MCLISWWRRRQGEQRYHTDTSRLSIHRDGKSTYLVVDEEGRFIKTGNPVWVKTGQNAHWIGLPWVSSYTLRHDLNALLTYPTNGSKISITVVLTLLFESEEFDFQELYDKVVKGDGDHLFNWITNLFKTAAMQDKAVLAAFKDYVKHERPVKFIEDLGQALRGLEFSGRPLSNMKGITAMPELNTVTVTTRATYDGVT